MSGMLYLDCQVAKLLVANGYAILKRMQMGKSNNIKLAMLQKDSHRSKDLITMKHLPQ